MKYEEWEDIKKSINDTENAILETNKLGLSIMSDAYVQGVQDAFYIAREIICQTAGD